MFGGAGNAFNADPGRSGVAPVSLFDSAQEHLKAMNAIRKLCGKEEEEEDDDDDTVIERFRSSVTFIRDWKHFRYAPRTVKFSCDTEGQQGKYVICEENLPQFSSANVPKTERLSSSARFAEASTDYVLYVGGHVWALDWCPNVRQLSECHTKCEYLAVSAHPPESSYHKIGVPLIGRGVIQIWCLVHAVKDELQIASVPRPRKVGSKKIGRPRKVGSKKIRRPRKNKDTDESLDDIDDEIDSPDLENEMVQGTLAWSCDVKEKKLRPRKVAFKKKIGRSRKKKDTDSLDDTVDGVDSSDCENEMVQGTATRSCDVKEKKLPPLKRAPGRPKKQKDLKESIVYLESLDRDDGSDNSKGENNMIQGTAARVCDRKVKKTLPLKKARGRPKNQKNSVESLFGSENGVQLCDVEEEKSLPPKKGPRRPRKQKAMMKSLVDSELENKLTPFSANIEQASSGFLGLTEVTKKSPGNALPVICDLIGSETDVQLCDVKEEKSLPPKRGPGRPRKKKRPGRPRKQKDMMKSLVDLDLENKLTPTFSAKIEQASSEFLGLTEVTKKSPGNALPVIRGPNNELRDSRREHLRVEAVQLCDMKERKTHLRRGRPRKQKDMKEPSADLDSEKDSRRSSQFLTLTDATRSTNEHAPQKYCGTNDMLDDSNKNQMVPITAVQVCDVREHAPLPLKTVRRRPSKQAIKKFLLGLEAESETVSALPAEEDTQGKSHDMDDRLYSDRGNQISQATVVQVVDAKEKDPFLSSKKRGRPKKQRETMEALVNLETEKNSVPALAVDISEVPSAFLASTEAHDPFCDTNVERKIERVYQRRYRKPVKRIQMKGKSKTKSNGDRSPLLLAQDEDLDPSVDDLKGNKGCRQGGVTLFSDVANEPLEVSTSSFEIPKDLALPRVVLCLAHNGKVAWDVKWKPPTESGEEHKHRIGYLAVLLGNGSIEVWEIPSPKAIEILYSSLKMEGRDPRFVKLEPVFKCSKLKSGDRHSIPLTVEWSRSSPHNLLLAGCHDGTVALWKFTPSGNPQDTRPLLCFNADTNPIRALAWAPDESDEESPNIVATAGHGGIRFWDIRDPYRPLWEFTPVRRFIYSIDWLQDPRCVMMTYDDGSLRILSLSKFSSDVAVSGKPSETQQPGSQNYSCSSYAIWSIHASRRTGQVMYCGAEGSARCFQVTRKMIDHDHARNRGPHFLCGSLSQENSTLAVNTPWPNVPIKVMKPMANSWGDAPNSIQDAMFLNQTRANDQTPERGTIALVHEDDTFGSKSISASKSKTTSKKRKIEPALIQVDKSPKAENRENINTRIEVLPPKMVALHRVRWNMNKGSERWVCYGGAAGIVRCQVMSQCSTMEFPSD